MALVALSFTPDPGQLDLRCYRLMAELAEDSDPRVRSVSRVGAMYFLGRIDADERQDLTETEAQVPASDQEALLRRCGDVMGEAGHDFRAMGERLVRQRTPV